jgi:hypothetical protein
MTLTQIFLSYISLGILCFLLDDYEIIVTTLDAETGEKIDDISFTSVLLYLIAFAGYVLTFPRHLIDVIMENF